jgi:hypothetical protein
VNASTSVAEQAGAILRRHGLALGLGLVILFKLWLVHTEDIYGSATEYDALWYVGSAKNWYWGSPYSWTAFIRPPAYPLFIALVHLVGLPLRLAIELLQITACLILIDAFRKAAVPALVCVLAFAAMTLHPASFQFNNYTMSDSFYAAILPFAVGGLLLTLLTAKIRHAVWTGVMLAILWNAREESFLIPGVLAVFLFLALRTRRSSLGSWKAGFVFWRKPAGTMLGTLALLLLAVNTANYFAFHSFTKSDMTSPAFTAAHKALLRIKPSQVRHYVAVSNEAVQKAYEVSPSFALLKPQLEGDLGRNWRVPATAVLGVPEYGPWFMWALRSVTTNTDSLHATPQSANRFYRNIAREINRACDEGRLPCRFVLSSFLDPEAFSHLGYFPESLGRTIALFVRPHHKITVREDAILTAPQRALYDEMTSRQPDYTQTPIPDTVNAQLSITLENIIGNTYRFLVIALASAALIAALVIARFFHRFRLSDPVNAALVLIGATIVIRLIFFAFLDAIWWTDDYERYLFPVMPLTSCFLILLIYQAIAIWRSRSPVSIILKP